MDNKEEELGICPFNPQHRLARYRLPYHIVKCKKSYYGPPLEVCPFNAMHYFPDGELAMHRENCMDYHTFMRERYENQHSVKLNTDQW